MWLAKHLLPCYQLVLCKSEGGIAMNGVWHWKFLVATGPMAGLFGRLLPERQRFISKPPMTLPTIMKTICPKTAGVLPVILGICLAAGFSLQARAANLVSSFEARDVTMPVYFDLSDNPGAVWRVGHVFEDHRRLGFFRVRLLPVLVADNISLECLQTNASLDWVKIFHSLPAEVTQKNGTEWRDFKLAFAGETSPCLQASRVNVKNDGSVIICRLEGMTLRTDTGTVSVPLAELHAEAHAARVTWQSAGRNNQWDLASGHTTTNTISPGVHP